jgi:hypothetical protein
MGIKGSKPKLSKEDLEFLKKNTNFTEEQIKEWYKGFVVSIEFFTSAGSNSIRVGICQNLYTYSRIYGWELIKHFFYSKTVRRATSLKSNSSKCIRWATLLRAF